jgi:DNA-binding NarL/FixJ family response regulator
MKILVIENSSAVCSRLLELLSESGRYEGMGCVTCAAAAIELIEDCRPAALLLDVRLADGSGFKLLETLRNGMNPVPTVLLAEIDSAQYLQRAEALGAAVVLNKTQQFGEIVPALDRLLGSVPGATHNEESRS